MANTREKLIAMCGDLMELPCCDTYEGMADHLIANGVTFATDNNVGGKWISVEDRLPEDGELVLVLASGKPCENITLVDAYEMAEYSGDDNCGWILEMYPMWEDAKVTHWMPLPEPPNCGADMRGENCV